MPGTHALIIEDNLDSIEILAHLLSIEGITYKAVSRPTKLTADDLHDVTMVFLDLDMPGMNGYEVFNILRHVHGFTAPIVAYTVNTNERSTTRSLGFDGMIAKPVDPTCFRRQLQHLIAGEPVWDDC